MILKSKKQRVIRLQHTCNNVGYGRGIYKAVKCLENIFYCFTITLDFRFLIFKAVNIFFAFGKIQLIYSILGCFYHHSVLNLKYRGGWIDECVSNREFTPSGEIHAAL